MHRQATRSNSKTARTTRAPASNTTPPSDARPRATLRSPVHGQSVSGEDPSADIASRTRRRAATSDRTWWSRGSVLEPKTRS